MINNYHEVIKDLKVIRMAVFRIKNTFIKILKNYMKTPTTHHENSQS